MAAGGSGGYRRAMSNPPHALRRRGAAWGAAATAVLLLATACSGPNRPEPPFPSPSPSATPSATPVLVIGTVDTGSQTQTLALRHLATTSGNVLARIQDGTQLEIHCTVTGQGIEGTQGSTTVWDEVLFEGRTGYVSAAYLRSGTDPTIPVCAARPTQVATPLPLPAEVTSDPGARIVALARSQRGVAERRNECNPYGPCVPWDASFATWVWRQAGLDAPETTSAAELYRWGERQGRAYTGLDDVTPGDLVLHGTGPEATQRVDILIEAHPDRLRVIGGDADDRVVERDVYRDDVYGWVDAR